MTILRSGASKKYSDNWNSAFGGKKKKATKKKSAAAKKKNSKAKSKSGRKS